MNFQLDEDQRALRDSVNRLMTEAVSFEKRRAIAATDKGWSDSVWQQLVQLGVTALPLPERHGGFGGKAVDLLPVMQEFGKALLLEPFLASIVLGATAVRLSGDEEFQAELLPRVATGELRLAWAHDEPAGRHAPLWVETTARRVQGQWRLDGAKTNVLHAPSAHRVVVSARVAGSGDDRDGVALFIVDAKAAGLLTKPHRMVDDSSGGDLRLNDVAALPLGQPADAMAAVDGTIAWGMAAVCADAVGAMEAAHKLALDYLNTRKQFGRLLGENQALRHRAAEMQVSLEMCRSIAIAAAVAVDDPNSADARTDLMRAKLMIGKHGRSLCQNAIQLHGGIGMTEEYAVGHYLRRVTLIDQLFGDADAQAARLAALG